MLKRLRRWIGLITPAEWQLYECRIQHRMQLLWVLRFLDMGQPDLARAFIALNLRRDGWRGYDPKDAAR